MVFKLEIKFKNVGQAARIVFFERKNWESALKKAKKILTSEDGYKSFSLEEHEAEWEK